MLIDTAFCLDHNDCMRHIRTSFIICCIVLVAVVLRLHNFENPPYDRHSFRQTDTLAIAERMATGESTFFVPTLYHSKNIENIGRYHLAELPMYEWLMQLFAGDSGQFVFWGRVINIVFGLSIIVGLYLIGSQLGGLVVGVAAAAAFALFPSSIFWTRAITPEILGLAGLVWSIVVLVRARKHTAGTALVAGALFTLALLTKPSYLGFAPLIFVLLQIRYIKISERSLEKVIHTGIVFLVPALIFVAWRAWISTFPDEAVYDPPFTRLMHGDLGYWQFWSDTEWPRKLFTDWVLTEMVTPVGGFFAVVGLVVGALKKKVRWVLAGWLASVAAISLILSWGSMIHDYYLLPWLPLLAVLVGFGVDAVWQSAEKLEEMSVVALGIGLFIVALVYWGQFLSIRDRFFEPERFSEESYLQDYADLNGKITNDQKILLISQSYSPLPINILKREGQFLAIPDDQPCWSREEINSWLGRMQELEPKDYLLFVTRDYDLECRRADIQKYLDERFERVWEGNNFVLYEGQQTKQQAFSVSGQGSLVYLRIEGYIDDLPTIEVGGIPGTESTIEVSPSWEQEEDLVYSAVLDATEWMSFKLFWENPKTFVTHSDWVFYEGWVVRQ